MKYSKTVRIAHRVDDLFDLVSDVEKYPRFIRWIRRLDVRDKKQVHDQTECVATAKVGFSGFSETMSTRVVAHRHNREIDVSLVKGPLRKLNNQWSFHAVSECETDVSFVVDFEFRNPILAMLARTNFDRAYHSILGAFSEEADRRYKTSS